LKRSKIRVKCNAKNINITRNNNGIVSLRINGEEYLYDEIVIATTPGSVKDLLMDMSTQEIQIFNDWDDQNFKTLAHNDLGFYKKLKNIKKTQWICFINFITLLLVTILIRIRRII
jgi:predicted NAD/FAD-binding protein